MDFAERWSFGGLYQCTGLAGGFGHGGAGYPYDILELGGYLVGMQELGFGQCFMV
jgi:hypothetical protein